MREEAKRIKLEFNRLAENNNISDECKMIFKSMLMLINLLIAIFLEKTTKKDNKNSSKPSSQTGKDESALTHQGTNGKGKPENDTATDTTRTVENVTLIKLEQCNVCGESLKNTACHEHERRTKIDIIFEKVIEHVDVEVKHCATCDSTVKGKFPVDMPGPLQYGNGLKAYIINLLIGQMISLNRVQKLVKSIVGEVIAETSFLKFIFRLYQALEQWESKAINNFLKMTAMNVDKPH